MEQYKQWNHIFFTIESTVELISPDFSLKSIPNRFWSIILICFLDVFDRSTCDRIVRISLEISASDGIWGGLGGGGDPW